MEINIINQSNDQSWEAYQSLFIEIASRCERVLSISKEYVLSVIFVDSKAIHQMNREYRKIDRPTDVISFALKDSDDTYEMMEEEQELGDIFINVEAIIAQANEYGHSIRRECCFLFTHGMLHLLGFDHLNEDDEKEMFTYQEVILDEIVQK